MLLCTGMHHFEVSSTALYPLAYVPARTSTYHLVLPCTRGTGFQVFPELSAINQQTVVMVVGGGM
jgi:hypothetical protein